MPTTDLHAGERASAPVPADGGNGMSPLGDGAPASSYLHSIRSALGWGPADHSNDTARMAETLPTPTAPSIFDRAISNLRVAWREIAARVGGAAADALQPDLPEEDARRLAQRIEECLANRGGEVSARARAAQIGRAYLGLSPTGRLRFLKLLADNFGPDRARIEAAMATYSQAEDRAAVSSAVVELREAAISPRVRLLTQLTTLPDGFKFLVDLRAELLKHLSADKTLAGLDRDLQMLFTSWFDIGLLTLERIDWESPASLLEKLIAVEVALVAGMADNIQKLLDERAPHVDPAIADAAIFYSISNTQTGLRGISFGNFLIKRVVDSLSHELPRLKTFATLSPIPGFRAWLDRHLGDGESALLTAAKKSDLRAVLADPGWAQDEAIAEALAPTLRRLCAHYLLQEKSNGKPLDPVARFHLANGARIERLNWLADTSAKGLQESAGVMVNYLYRLADIEAHHEAYVAEGRVAAAAAVKALLKT